MTTTSNSRNFFTRAAVVAATTVGAGMFALPYVVNLAGWMPSLFYLGALGVILVFVHGVYFLVLKRVHERRKLVGIVHDVLGRKRGMASFVVVMGGQILTLLVYLVLGRTFLSLLFPTFPPEAGALLFWAFSALPLLLNVRRFARLETWGAIGMFVLVGLLFLGGDAAAGWARPPLADGAQAFLPFGIMLFALAGWTAVEPVYELGGDPPSFRAAFSAFAAGTGVSVLLYFLFILAVLGSPTPITPDAVSGFSDPLHRAILGLLGLFAVWTSYLPTGREAMGAFVDAGTKKPVALLLVLFLPLVLFGMGLSDFVRLVSLVGGVFLGLQYLFILGVGKKMLRPEGYVKVLFWLLFVVLGVGVVYELYYFIVQ